jgi:hypothetical protein
MPIQWDSLHFYTSQPHKQVATALANIITDMGYGIYDPFTIMQYKVYRQKVKFFVGMTTDGWVRAIGEFPLDVSAQLSMDGLVLHLHLTDETADAHVFVKGRPQPFSALQPHLRAGVTVAHLHDAILRGGQTPSRQTEAIPMNVLPEEIQAMAKGVNSNQVNRLFNKMMGQVNRVMGDKGDSAKELLSASVPDWTHGQGGNIRTFMSCLTIPQNWHTPDFITLRDAYMAHQRIEKNPSAQRLPSDTEAMKAVPDALSYIPIYGGK